MRWQKQAAELRRLGVDLLIVAVGLPLVLGMLWA